MRHALFPHPSVRLEPRHVVGADVLYLGSESCARALPSFDAIDEIMKRVRPRAFALVTPPVSNELLDSLTPLMERLNDRYPGSEVVANDFGVLEKYFTSPTNLVPVAGRLISKYIVNGGDSLLGDIRDRFGLHRLEFDARYARLARADRPCSYYTPYTVVSMTRFCAHKRENLYTAPLTGCDQACLTNLVRLGNKVHPDLLLDQKAFYQEIGLSALDRPQARQVWIAVTKDDLDAFVDRPSMG